MKPRSTAPLHVEKDQSGFDLGTQLIMAVLFLMALILQQIYLPVGWEFDFNSPDFNPLIFLPVLLIGIVLWSLIKAGLYWRHLKRFGASFMELSVRAPLAQGSVCRGRVRTELPLSATGDYQITLRCLEGYRFRSPGEIDRATDRIHYTTAWEETRTVPYAAVDSSAGLPFDFELPVRGPLQPFIETHAGENRPYFKMKASFNIPFLKKKIITHNQKPDTRSWLLEVSAPTMKGDFRAKFQVPVQEK